MTWARQLRRAWASLLFACVMAGFGAARQSFAQTEATTIPVGNPFGVAYDANGNLYVASQTDHVVRKVDLLGMVTTVAGTGEQGFSGDGGAASGAQLDTPSGLAIDASGNLYIADSHNHRIRRVSSGTITTVAGNGMPGFSGDGGAATGAQLDDPTGICLDSTGNLYIADSGNSAVRKLANGVITTIAGTGQQGFSGDGGPGTTAQLDTPTGVAADPNVPGQIYIADRHNHRIRLLAANGTISTVAGTGAAAFSGDGGAGTAAALDGPRGVATSGNGLVYVADSDNQRVRVLSGGTISTVAGDGEQGFAGDIGNSIAAILNTPAGLALSPTGELALADLHNGRVRAVLSSNINTVAGIAPVLTEGLLLAGTTSGVYGTSLGQLTATFSNGTNQGTGRVTLYEDGAAVTSQTLSGNRASFDLSGTGGGLHTFAAAYAGDSVNAAIASGIFLVNVSAAPQTIAFPALPTNVTYSPGSTVPLTATASSGLPVTFSVTSGPATVSGTTLSLTGPGTVTITATQAGSAQYAAVSASQSITVLPPSLALNAISPSTSTLGAQNFTLTVSGSGFTQTSVVELNGTAVKTMFVNSSTVVATLPQLLMAGTVNVTIFDSASQSTTAPATLTVVAPAANALVSVPPTSNSGRQPTIGLQLGAVYPVPLTGVLSLSFTSYGNLNVDDPSIQFSQGGRTLNFTVPANSTATPALAIQTGTVAGVITLTLSLTAQGLDVTPTTARVSTIVVQPQVPSAALSFTQNGTLLTVTVHGFSNTRNMSTANFTFAPAAGSSLATKTLSIPVSAIFSTWYSDPASTAEGSIFTYTQTFQLSDPNAQVQSVGLQLTNSVGPSALISSP